MIVDKTTRDNVFLVSDSYNNVQSDSPMKIKEVDSYPLQDSNSFAIRLTDEGETIITYCSKHNEETGKAMQISFSLTLSQSKDLAQMIFNQLKNI